MITRFGSLFPGYVDLSDLGLDGIPVNERWLPNDQLLTIFDKCQAIAQQMDRSGYETFWAAEHHFQREGYECVPNLLMLFVHLAQVTTNVKFGCGFNITPMWHPLRLAEDFATADALTDGRIIFGVGRGYHTREVETFGAPLIDSDANRDLFEEQMEIIFKAFNQPSFSHHGKHYDIPAEVPYRGYDMKEITLVPRPRHLPVECYQPIVSAGQRGIDFMIKHGIKGMVGGGAAISGPTDNVLKAWQDAQRHAGRETELGTDLILGYSVHLAETEKKAVDELRDYFEENIKMFGPLGFVRGLTQEQISDLGDRAKARGAGIPTIEDAVASGSWICGPPDQVTEKIMVIQDKYPGLEELNVGCTVMGMAQTELLEQIEWFGKEVMPTFKGQAKPAVLAD